ncbi:anhydro-N-acetylmuramic acid kinase [Aquidulcibacter paucihalophilus]|uniref:anhydro-N-acetylmuramic acid kinase n=1 Tax=Aquidulcibacter paucihalophilus TaxID=1978549 RepID=UPI0018E32B26|nr:anhydro-N-acetylmuramic acid kinase [Aquidulcibacter paucihalophilus]
MTSWQNETFFAVGLMSGTSRDGIDAALIETDGIQFVRSIGFSEHIYDKIDRDLIEEACSRAMSKHERSPDLVIEECEERISKLHIQVVADLLGTTGFDSAKLAVIGFHGHTVAHRADLGWTWQIGDAQRLSDELKVTVVSDLRQNDMRNGGQGAPLLPVYHRALFARPNEKAAVLNLGGVANLTFLGPDGDMIAFDCGMANALIDDQMSKSFGLTYDYNGQTAETGAICEETLAQLLEHPFFALPYPKSLDRMDFSIDSVCHLSGVDAVATLTAFSAAAVSKGLGQLPSKVDKLIVTGGGRKNQTLMRMIGESSGHLPTKTEDFGWNGDAIEAQGFAYMAVRRLKSLPITFPGTTGAPTPLIGGIICQPSLQV